MKWHPLQFTCSCNHAMEITALHINAEGAIQIVTRCRTPKCGVISLIHEFTYQEICEVGAATDAEEAILQSYEKQMREISQEGETSCST